MIIKSIKSKDGSEITPELTAVITAAVTLCMESASITPIHVRPMRRSGMNAPLWSHAGRTEYHLSRLS